MDILCVGLAVVDILVKPVDASCFGRDSTPVGPIRLQPGGDAANVAVNASALGLKTGLISVTGQDELGHTLRDSLAGCGVDTTGMVTAAGQSTATCVVLVDTDGQRHFLTHVDIFSELKPTHISDTFLNNTRAICLGGAFRLPALDDGGIAPIFAKARQSGVVTAMDTVANRRPPALPRLEAALAHTDLFLPSYDEAVDITGERDVRAMARRLSRFPLKIFAVKCGGDGCYVTDFKREFCVGAFPADSIADTVGAGDAFVAGFLHGYLAGRDLPEIAVFANAVAAHNLRQPGATGGIPGAETVDAFIDAHRHRVVVEKVTQ